MSKCDGTKHKGLRSSARPQSVIRSLSKKYLKYNKHYKLNLTLELSDPRMFVFVCRAFSSNLTVLREFSSQNVSFLGVSKISVHSSFFQSAHSILAYLSDRLLRNAQSDWLHRCRLSIDRRQFVRARAI